MPIKTHNRKSFLQSSPRWKDRHILVEISSIKPLSGLRRKWSSSKRSWNKRTKSFPNRNIIRMYLEWCRGRIIMKVEGTRIRFRLEDTMSRTSKVCIKTKAPPIFRSCGNTRMGSVRIALALGITRLRCRFPISLDLLRSNNRQINEIWMI
jgi:hypothetical protein